MKRIDLWLLVALFGGCAMDVSTPPSSFGSEEKASCSKTFAFPVEIERFSSGRGEYVPLHEVLDYGGITINWNGQELEPNRIYPVDVIEPSGVRVELVSDGIFWNDPLETIEFEVTASGVVGTDRFLALGDANGTPDRLVVSMVCGEAFVGSSEVNVSTVQRGAHHLMGMREGSCAGGGAVSFGVRGGNALVRGTRLQRSTLVVSSDDPVTEVIVQCEDGSIATYDHADVCNGDQRPANMFLLDRRNHGEDGYVLECYH